MVFKIKKEKISLNKLILVGKNNKLYKISVFLP